MDVGLFGCSGQKTCKNVGVESYFWFYGMGSVLFAESR